MRVKLNCSTIKDGELILAGTPIGLPKKKATALIEADRATLCEDEVEVDIDAKADAEAKAKADAEAKADAGGEG